MIPRDSQSFPYLAIAQYLHIDYGEVLGIAEFLDNNSSAATYWLSLEKPRKGLYQLVAEAVLAERERRIQVQQKG